MSGCETNPPWLEEIEHTADAGFRVVAPDLEQLFERAAFGLFSVITDMSDVRPISKTVVTVSGQDLGALLVQWLSELNFRHITRRQLFCRFDILKLSDVALEAEVFGEPIDLARHRLFTEVKAVTFHGLKVEQTDNGWRAEVILDL